jgi:hypothetical protein
VVLEAGTFGDHLGVCAQDFEGLRQRWLRFLLADGDGRERMGPARCAVFQRVVTRVVEERVDDDAL